MSGIAYLMGPLGMGIGALIALIFGSVKLCQLMRESKPWQSDAEARRHEDIIKGQRQ